MPKARSKAKRGGRAAAKRPPVPPASATEWLNRFEAPAEGTKAALRATGMAKPPKRDGAISAALRVAQERLRMQHESLRALHTEMNRARQRYHSLFEHASVGYITLSAGGLVLEVNHTAAKLLGGKRILIRNSPLTFWILPEDRHAFAEHLAACRAKEETIATELRLVDSSGETLPVQLVSSRSTDPELGLELRTGIVDLRDLKRAQAELQRARDEMEIRVQERTAELRASNAQLAEEVNRRERLEGEVIAVSERERRRFGQDLHDETCQTLGGLALTAGLLARRLDRTDPEAAKLARELSQGLGAAIEQTRAIARSLHPVTMEGGLRAALEALVARLEPKISCELRCDPDLRLPEDYALCLYRIAQESTMNVLKHARASRLTIEVRKNAHAVVLSVSDDGQGLPKSAPKPECMGLDIMGFRARLLGGSCVVENASGGGARVTCYLPWPGGAEKVGGKSGKVGVKSLLDAK